MTNPTRMILTVAFSLLSVLTARAANIRISSLPFTITAPGTYVLTSNLSATTAGYGAAISIAGNIPGPVILNLNGFTISGGYEAIIINGSSTVPNQYPVTVKNGTITNFVQGIIASGNYIDLNGLTFSNIQSSFTSSCIIVVGTTNACTIRNCVFSNSLYGIADGSTNSTYADLQFTEVTYKLFMSATAAGVGRCSLEPVN
jgi:hypothetical protein